MKNYIQIISLFIVSFMFSQRHDLGVVVNDVIDEASGIVSSRKNNIIWVHNDSGGKSRVYAVGKDGSHLGELRLVGTIALDWEDMCIGPGPEHDEDYLYIADIGDNFSKRKIKKIYRFKEPIINVDSLDVPFSIKIDNYSTTKFYYPDGKRDAESVMIDQRTGDLFVVSKREPSPHVYHIATQWNANELVEASFIGKVTLTPNKQYSREDQIVAADISRDNKMILFKTYNSVILIIKDNMESLSDAINKRQIELDYITEPQGESICWDPLGNGYYTLSEEPNNIAAHLYYYPVTIK